jgi:putative DNA primase/helicase
MIPIGQETNGEVVGLTARLLPKHLADLRKSGLTDATIAACGFHSLQAPASIQGILRWKCYSGELGDCLVIPFFDVDGKPTGYGRLKPDRPRLTKDGKLIKYESPRGLPNRAYFPPATWAKLHDPACLLLITEGEKKAAKADQHGFRCIGLVGVYGWQRRRLRDTTGKPQGERQLIDCLVSVPWKGRLVFICFDSDATTNPDVRRAQWHLAETLSRLGARVRIVHVPPGEQRADSSKPMKVGLDDFLIAHGPDSLQRLLAEATLPEPPRGLEPIEAADDPHRLAGLFLKQKCHHADAITLRFWREEWHRWNGSAYEVVPDKELRAELTRSAKEEMDRMNLIAQRMADEKNSPTARKVTGRLVADVAHALASITLLPGRIETPTWLEGDSPFPSAGVLACRNGLVDLSSLVAGKPFFHAPTPRFFSPACLDFDFDLKAHKPTSWVEFLAQLWPEDPESITTLGDWFGYCLTPTTRFQKILLLVGPKRSGKGTVARILRALVGPANTAGPPLSSLSQNFGLQPLLGKNLAIISDARLGPRSDVATIAERLLAISGEDAITVDRKNLPPVTVQLPTRFMLLTNELPRLSDSSGALAGRFIILRLTRSWFGSEDLHLTDRLLVELPGILLWAIAGWQRLRDRERFVQPASSHDLAGALEDLSSPIGAFVRECCRIGPGCQVEKAALFEAWKKWCETQGREHPGDASTFGRNLRAAIPSVGESRPRTIEGRSNVYEGIALKTGHPWSP